MLEKHNPEAEPISLVYPQARNLSPKVRVFIDFMLSQFKKPRLVRSAAARLQLNSARR